MLCSPGCLGVTERLSVLLEWAHFVETRGTPYYYFLFVHETLAPGSMKK